MKPLRVVIVGASGAIGEALARQYLASDTPVQLIACSRQPVFAHEAAVDWRRLDLSDEDSIAGVARYLGEQGPVDRVIICTGVLHAGDRQPEKSLQALAPAWLRYSFEINAIGPALLLKHFLPLLRADTRSVCAALSARVGSISDNRLGGWYSYRAAKAALNMLITTAAIELKRRNPQAVLVGLHPGTVDSGLSKPFQARLKPGQLQSPEQAALALMRVIESASSTDSGRCLSYDGSVLPA
ncbi:MAG: hypothetical protein RLZZ227_2283 [Pseudomonadota bacterium]|jgi:NAD(P)-dependent dehydrogenase (short-subunit alcohol dehydrogenase family)